MFVHDNISTTLNAELFRLPPQRSLLYAQGALSFAVISELLSLPLIVWLFPLTEGM
jgi:hypothetical protein